MVFDVPGTGEDEIKTSPQRLVDSATPRSSGHTRQYTCHCAEGCGQNNINEYRCQSCVEGFYGPYCQKENVALHRTTTQSPECSGYEAGASLAVDGNTTTIFGNVRYKHKCTCARDVSPMPTQWRVDLRKQYQLHKIQIFNTKGNENRLWGFKIYVDNSNTPCYRWTSRYALPEVFNVTCDAQGQVVKFQLPGSTFLQLCEVQIFDTKLISSVKLHRVELQITFELNGSQCKKMVLSSLKENASRQRLSENEISQMSCGFEKLWNSKMCSDDWYGDNCDKTCNCQNQNVVCNKTTGACDTCVDRYWGPSCTKQCSSTCKDSSCDKGNGNCLCTYWHVLMGIGVRFATRVVRGIVKTLPVRNNTGIVYPVEMDTGVRFATIIVAGIVKKLPVRNSPGIVNVPCVDGYWDSHCTKKCPNNCGVDTCDKVTGSCPCADGYWGPSCSNRCGYCIGSSCNKQDGSCQCRTGWAPPTCALCDQGYYGTNCSETCGYCVNGSTTCHNVTGRCPGGCSAGWRDDTCKRACEDGYYGDKCNNSCGHCLNGNTTCNKVTGYCHAGCGAGWKGDTCKIECSNGTHGTNCEQICSNCKESNCDRFNGTCFDGCIAGYANPGTGCVETCMYM
ncbi:multiple epidermal growth factor-like domains protein 10 [Gigantopelta aegis]|uniref:multiple epidermal growth factor-like domains protein 10 n=1 Tax=Gigantopelta aegis TaxID=1735272 RepID=UPI001B88855D|nr:multiple epidermal growth factor-like domains protein 10 [Gigantopelta aegis]